jgi:hypothetical protein
MRGSDARIADPNQEFKVNQPETTKAGHFTERKGQSTAQITAYLITK